jgi:hypothetical protein
LSGSVGFTGVPGPLSTDFTVHNGAVVTPTGDSFGLSIGGNYRNQPVTNIVVDHMHVANASAVGIAVVALDATITDNTIINTRNTRGLGTATGIDVESIDIAASDALNPPLQGSKASSRVVIQGNIVTNTSSQTFDENIVAGTPQAVGIKVASFADITISGNNVISTFVPRQVPAGVAVGIYVDATKGFCGHADCPSAQLGGLIVQNNNVSPLNSRVAVGFAHNSIGIKVSHAPDHAIVVGSKISQMDTGIDVARISWPGTPPVLLLDNSFSQVAISNVGGVNLPQ